MDICKILLVRFLYSKRAINPSIIGDIPHAQPGCVSTKGPSFNIVRASNNDDFKLSDLVLSSIFIFDMFEQNWPNL